MAEIIGNLEQLLTAVQHTAHSDADHLRGDADERARNIRDDAEERASRIRESILGDARAEADEIRRRHAVQMTREARREYLEAREGLLEKVWQGASVRLDEIREDADRYRSVLRCLLFDALALTGGGEYLVASDAKGHELLAEKQLEEWASEAGERLNEKIRLVAADEPAPECRGDLRRVAGGLVVSERQGRRRINMSFAARLELARDELREEVARRLLADE